MLKTSKRNSLKNYLYLITKTNFSSEHGLPLFSQNLLLSCVKYSALARWLIQKSGFPKKYTTKTKKIKILV